jgi:hypothetical protein
MKYILAALAFLTAFTTACGSVVPTPSREQQIQLAVAGTLSSLPRNTPVPRATTPVLPTSTPVSLSGLYCEYRFCIGHPADLAFYDVSAAQNQASPSSYTQGILAAYSSTLFLQVVWQPAPGGTDPQFMIDLILQYGADTRNGNVQPKLVGPLNVFYVPIIPTAAAASTLPSGGAAAWLCGGRAFAWKAYTPQQNIADSLMMDALSRFRCEAQ